jgi:hypothetical protein
MLWKGIIIIVILCLAVVIYLIAKNYFWMKKQINFEMQDVRNIATIKSVEMNYQNMKEE